MAYKMIENYPEYLRDFEDIKSISEEMQLYINTYRSVIKQMLKYLKLSSVKFSPWVDVLKGFVELMDYDKKARLQHTVYPIVRLEELKELMECWIVKGRYMVDFDVESATVTVRCVMNEYVARGQMKFIRDMIPCNMDFKMELVDAL